ncbi:MAG: translation initiation factor IF-2 [Bdellovibrionales bacterium]|nr:translation initiation factor IF-2 [Bdellovibrionales bacterium]
MEQPKVFEFAKEIGMETLALMDKIREWKLPVKSHMAPLNPTLIEEIKARIEKESGPSSAKKKKTVRKSTPAVTTKKTAAPTTTVKAAVKKAAAKPIAKPVVARAVEVKATVEETIAEPPVSGTLPPISTKKNAVGVIRRKAGELEARAQALAEQEAIAQAIAAQNREAVVEESSPVIINENAFEEVSEPVNKSAPQPQPVSVQTVPIVPVVTEEPRRPRGNIIGRMDLRRVVTPTGSSPSNRSQRSDSSTAGANTATTAGSRPPRSAPRGIRTGFVAPLPMEDLRVDTEVERKEREEKERKKRNAQVREEEQVFTATEFRKREVIFQPKKKRPITARDVKKNLITTPKASKRIVKVDGSMKVGDLASSINIKTPVLIKKLMTEGVVAAINTDLDFDTISLIVPEFGWEAVNTHKSADELLKDAVVQNTHETSEEIIRPPVVTVMGHVDHGKTTLLDSIRKTNVASKEAGGITQHIGAYSVKLESGHYVTFIDTPGHEAFTAMRARGANATDIAIIVVAADDGMMPQTAEAINHAKAAGVPIIVAVNKMDRPGANPERIKQQLTEFELVPEEWGGTTTYCPVSALKKEGIKELLNHIHLIAEIQELKANPKRNATGLVIESRMEKGRGAVATLLVKDGTLRIGDPFVVGSTVGRIRSMINDQGRQVKEVSPGFAVEIMGLPEPPQAGDQFDAVQDESLAHQVADQRKKVIAQAELNASKPSLEELFAKVKAGEKKELSIILKTDVAGSLEAVKALIDKSSTDEVKTKIVHSAIGGVTASDVLLAGTAKGIILGFNVRPDGEAQRMAKEKNIEIRSYTIIYELMDDLKKMMTGLLDPKFEEKVLGRAEVRNTFVVPKVGTIAGSFILDGKIIRGCQVRLLRDGRIINVGKLSSLKRFKDDAREVASGFECGIGIENFNDIKVGDVIEAFAMEQLTPQL